MRVVLDSTEQGTLYRDAARLSVRVFRVVTWEGADWYYGEPGTPTGRVTTYELMRLRWARWRLLFAQWRIERQLSRVVRRLRKRDLRIARASSWRPMLPEAKVVERP